MLFRANYGFSEWNREDSLDNRRPYAATKWCVVLFIPFYSRWLWKGRRGYKAAKDGDYQTALDLWLPMAKKGDAEAQFRIGFLNEQGQGEPHNIEQAVRLYARAAAQGHWRGRSRLKEMARNGIAITQFYLGENHITGFANNRDGRKAQIWFERAALQGLADAQVQLGKTYLPPSSSGGIIGPLFTRFFGRWQGQKRDIALAIHWFQAAADQGSAAGSFQLGLLFLLGHYVKQDIPAGCQLIEDAAAKGFGHAQIFLAVIYSEGEFLDPDPDRASYWFNKGESQINKEFEIEILVCLGIAYREGCGTGPDKTLAYKWLKLAEHKDQYRFRAVFGSLIKDLNKTMTKSEISAAIGLIETAYDEEISSL